MTVVGECNVDSQRMSKFPKKPGTNLSGKRNIIGRNSGERVYKTPPLGKLFLA